MMTREKVEQEVMEAMQSGLYKVAGMELFESLDKIDISENVALHLEYTNDLMLEYFEELMELKEKTPGLTEFLKAIKEGDVRDNHGLESENSFLIGLYAQMPRKTAMERLVKYAQKNKQLTGKDILSVHNTLLFGTLSDDEELIRTKNDKFVGKVVNGVRLIDYFPMDCKDIKEAANKIAHLYNVRLEENGFDNVFFQPFLIHGLFAALQMFNDGNTRMGRVVQHALLWQLINERTNFNFELPPIYATRSYYPFRSDYRNKIASLVKNNDSNAWNDWFNFNLARVEDSIYAGRENVCILKRKMKY